jgi:uridylate kinase
MVTDNTDIDPRMAMNTLQKLNKFNDKGIEIAIVIGGGVF